MVVDDLLVVVEPGMVVFVFCCVVVVVGDTIVGVGLPVVGGWLVGWLVGCVVSCVCFWRRERTKRKMTVVRHNPATHTTPLSHTRENG